MGALFETSSVPLCFATGRRLGLGLGPRVLQVLGPRGGGSASAALHRSGSGRMTHCVWPVSSCSRGQSCIVRTKKSENTKSISTIFFLLESFFFCCAELLTQNVEPIPKFKGELKVGRKSWFVQFLLFLQVTRKGFLYFYMRHYQSQAKMPRELAQKWQLSYLKGEIIFSQSVFSPIFVAHTQFWWLIFVVLKIQLSCVVSLASSI